MNTPKKIITHTAVSLTSHTVEDVDDWHKVRWPGFTSKIFKNTNNEFFHVGYHYVIEWDGTITQTRGNNEEGAHCIGMNKSSIGICFMGNGDVHLPSPEQVKSFKELYTSLSKEFGLNKYDLEPHRKYANKSCHGSKLSDTFFQDLIIEDSRKSLRQKIHMLKQIVSLLQTIIKLKK